MVTPCYYPVKGGTESIVRNLSINLNAIGVQTDVMTFNVNQNRKPSWRGKTENIDGITVYRIPALEWVPIKHSNRITSGINFIPGRFLNILERYDVIHFHEFEFSFPFFSLPLIKPKILHLHGIEYEFLKRHHMSRFLLKHVADIYISISRQMKNDLIKLKIPEKKIAYLPNGVDTDFFKPSGQKEDKLLLFVGRISPSKGVHVLIKSLEYVEDNVRLVIIGPPDWNLRYYRDVLELINKENRKGKHEIRYLGAMEQTELVKWYQKATIFILPSFVEGFPVSILEALSCETPVIATPIGGIPEAIRDYETGILFPPGNCFKLAKAIHYMLKNADVRLKIAQAGRKHVIQNYSLKFIVKKLQKIYEHLTG
ncbi:MAG: glycosyltransferase family 4 protein [Candidatus Bathyarchaeia archaeon]